MSNQKRWWGPGIKTHDEWTSVLTWGYEDYLDLRCLICHKELLEDDRGMKFPVQVTCSPECETAWMLRHV